MAGLKGRSGPPQNNLNASKNGGRISRLTLGELPQTMRRQLQSVRKYRRYLEGLVVDAHGEVNATHAHWIDEACAAETHAAVCRWLLRTRLDERIDYGQVVHRGKDGSKVVQAVGMSSGDIIKCSAEILKAKTIRNRAVAALGLNAPPADPWSVVDALPVPTDGEANGKTAETT